VVEDAMELPGEAAEAAPALRSPAERTPERLLAVLDTVKDPEVPVVSVVELGIVRGARWEGGEAVVTITPTYSGCPAMREIEADVSAAVLAAGADGVRVEVVHAPAWTTDWMGPEAREKLRRYGIAPPGPAASGRPGVSALVTLTRRREAVACPWCGSRDTTLQSEFGSTACKAIHRCNACRQPFDEFKPF
jgi:ring-1,2-phenylacetyl-CoA epoxidase subunit PaaD